VLALNKKNAPGVVGHALDFVDRPREFGRGVEL
jgi:hypothetical protein